MHNNNKFSVIPQFSRCFFSSFTKLSKCNAILISCSNKISGSEFFFGGTPAITFSCAKNYSSYRNNINLKKRHFFYFSTKHFLPYRDFLPFSSYFINSQKYLRRSRKYFSTSRPFIKKYFLRSIVSKISLRRAKNNSRRLRFRLRRVRHWRFYQVAAQFRRRNKRKPRVNMPICETRFFYFFTFNNLFFKKNELSRKKLSYVSKLIKIEAVKVPVVVPLTPAQRRADRRRRFTQRYLYPKRRVYENTYPLLNFKKLLFKATSRVSRNLDIIILDIRKPVYEVYNIIFLKRPSLSILNSFPEINYLYWLSTRKAGYSVVRPTSLERQFFSRWGLFGGYCSKIKNFSFNTTKDLTNVSCSLISRIVYDSNKIFYKFIGLNKLSFFDKFNYTVLRRLIMRFSLNYSPYLVLRITSLLTKLFSFIARFLPRKFALRLFAVDAVKCNSLRLKAIRLSRFLKTFNLSRVNKSSFSLRGATLSLKKISKIFFKKLATLSFFDGLLKISNWDAFLKKYLFLFSKKASPFFSAHHMRFVARIVDNVFSTKLSLVKKLGAPFSSIDKFFKRNFVINIFFNRKIFFKEIIYDPKQLDNEFYLMSVFYHAFNVPLRQARRSFFFYFKKLRTRAAKYSLAKTLNSVKLTRHYVVRRESRQTAVATFYVLENIFPWSVNFGKKMEITRKVNLFNRTQRKIVANRFTSYVQPSKKLSSISAAINALPATYDNLRLFGKSLFSEFFKFRLKFSPYCFFRNIGFFNHRSADYTPGIIKYVMPGSYYYDNLKSFNKFFEHFTNSLVRDCDMFNRELMGSSNFYRWPKYHGVFGGDINAELSTIIFENEVKPKFKVYSVNFNKFWNINQYKLTTNLTYTSNFRLFRESYLPSNFNLFFETPAAKHNYNAYFSSNKLALVKLINSLITRGRSLHLFDLDVANFKKLVFKSLRRTMRLKALFRIKHSWDLSNFDFNEVKNKAARGFINFSKKFILVLKNYIKNIAKKSPYLKYRLMHFPYSVYGETELVRFLFHTIFYKPVSNFFFIDKFNRAKHFYRRRLNKSNYHTSLLRAGYVRNNVLAVSSFEVDARKKIKVNLIRLKKYLVHFLCSQSFAESKGSASIKKYFKFSSRQIKNSYKRQLRRLIFANLPDMYFNSRKKLFDSYYESEGGEEGDTTCVSSSEDDVISLPNEIFHVYRYSGETGLTASWPVRKALQFFGNKVKNIYGFRKDKYSRSVSRLYKRALFDFNKNSGFYTSKKFQRPFQFSLTRAARIILGSSPRLYYFFKSISDLSFNTLSLKKNNFKSQKRELFSKFTRLKKGKFKRNFFSPEKYLNKRSNKFYTNYFYRFSLADTIAQSMNEIRKYEGAKELYLKKFQERLLFLKTANIKTTLPKLKKDTKGRSPLIYFVQKKTWTERRKNKPYRLIGSRSLFPVSSFAEKMAGHRSISLFSKHCSTLRNYRGKHWRLKVFIRHILRRKFNCSTEVLFTKWRQAKETKRKWFKYYDQFESSLYRILCLVGFAENTEEAISFIEGGLIRVNGGVLKTPLYKIKVMDIITLDTQAYLNLRAEKLLELLGDSIAATDINNEMKGRLLVDALEFTRKNAAIGSIARSGHSAKKYSFYEVVLKKCVKKTHLSRRKNVTYGDLAVSPLFNKMTINASTNSGAGEDLHGKKLFSKLIRNLSEIIDNYLNKDNFDVTNIFQSGIFVKSDNTAIYLRRPHSSSELFSLTNIKQTSIYNTEIIENFYESRFWY